MCEGNVANFTWRTNVTSDNAPNVFFYKKYPDYHLLTASVATKADGSLLERIDVIKHNFVYGILIHYANLSDSGTYTIEIYYGLPLLQVDSAVLHVLKSSGKYNYFIIA